MLLDSAVKNNPDTTWWIKGDGCDVVPGVCESVNMIWSGDVDLNDGELQKHYRTQLEFVSGIGLKGRQVKDSILKDLGTLHNWLVSDRDYAIKGAVHRVVTYMPVVYMYIKYIISRTNKCLVKSIMM